MTSISLDRQLVAKRLKEARKAKKISAQEAADAVSVGIKGFYHWESGKALPDLMQFKALARLYQASTDVLLFGSSFILISEELELMLHRLDEQQARKVENVVRATLDMTPLQPILAPEKRENLS